MSEQSTARWASLACLFEATASKVGNVHRGADFEDLTYADFVMSAWAIEPVFDRVVERGIGGTILDAIRATRRVVSTNTNLGIVLLLAPLAHAFDQSSEKRWQERVSKSLEQMNSDDARDAYRAIVEAIPGGLGDSPEHDVRGSAPASLLDAMTLAADRDLIARQYAERFDGVFSVVVPALEKGLAHWQAWEAAIVQTHIQVMATWPDSLIARKCGLPLAQQTQARAQRVLEQAPTQADSQSQCERWQGALADFDFWLRSDGHRRNPGTSADLVCAGIFVALCQAGLGNMPWQNQKG